MLRRSAWTGALVLVAVAVVATGSSRASTGKPGEMRLRLADFPAGYQVDSESGCGPLLAYEGTPPALAPFLRSAQPNGCKFEFDRNWTTSSPGATPAVVESAAVVFSSARDARAAYARRLLFIRYLFSTAAKPAAPRTSVKIGDESVLLTVDDVLVQGQIGEGSAVVSQQGPVLSIVLVGDGTPANALDLARKQSAHIARPTPVSPTETQRSKDVPLDNPRLPVPVYWLGRTFAAPHGLRLQLFEAYAGERSSGPGQVVKMDYQATEGRPRAGLTLDLWTPGTFASFSKTRLGRLVWASPCAKLVRVALESGYALLYGGYARATGSACPATAPDHYLAHVYFKGVVAAIDMPYCFSCAGLPSTDPFNSFAGLEAVVRALRPR